MGTIIKILIVSVILGGLWFTAFSLGFSQMIPNINTEFVAYIPFELRIIFIWLFTFVLLWLILSFAQ